VIIDYHVLAQLPNNQMIVLLIAVERRIIEERINLVKQAGLDPQLINVDGLALMEAFKSALPGSKGVVALLDIGYRLSKLVVMENDIPYFSRDIETGEQEIIQTISEKLGMDFNLSKELLYKRKDMEKDVTEAIKPVLNGLLEELSLSFEYCERNLNKKADRLYLSGGGSKVKILFESIGKIPNFKVDIWDPTKGFNVPSFSTNEELIEYAPILAVAVGLALG
jgi:type IV pilus assembly protein PilM